MHLFCSKCEKPAASPDVDESVDGWLYSCPNCDGPLLLVPYDEAEDVYRNLVTSMVLGINMMPGSGGCDCNDSDNCPDGCDYPEGSNDDCSCSCGDPACDYNRSCDGEDDEAEETCICEDPCKPEYRCPDCNCSDYPYGEEVYADKKPTETITIGIKVSECKDCDLKAVDPQFTKDEALYLLHITDKQLGKVNHAASQLINIKTKLGGYAK